MMGAYAASKFALEAISDALRREIAKQGVSVSLVEPGPIVTPIWEKSIAEAEDIKANYSEDLQDIYGQALARYKSRAKVHNKTGSPVAVVVEAIVHALTARRPRTRYPVGRGIRVLSTMAGNIPDSLLDKFMSRL
jgi:short-subunit dehydrogenase